MAREGAQVWTLRGHCRLGKAGRGARRWRAGQADPSPRRFPGGLHPSLPRWVRQQRADCAPRARSRARCPGRPRASRPSAGGAASRALCSERPPRRPRSDGAPIAPRTGPFPPLPAQLREFEVQQRSGAARPRLPAACGREQCDAERAPRTSPRLGLGPRAPLRGECTRPGGWFVFCFQLGFGIKSVSEPRGSRGRAVGERPG